MKYRYALIWFFLSFFSIEAFAQPAPCGPNPSMTSLCDQACVICDIDGYTGINDLTATGQGFPEFCTTQYNNMQYIAFIAGSEDLSIQVDVTNCSGGVNSLEVGFFETDDCENFTAITFCDTDIESNQSQTFENYNPLEIGQHYYLVIDGSGGANCNWTFTVLEGSTAVNNITDSGVITHPIETCPELPTTFQTTGALGASFFIWTIDGVAQPGLDTENEFIFPFEGTYEVCVTAANACFSADQACTTINVREIGTTNIDTLLCDGECLTVNGQQFCDTGAFQEIFTYPSGCDSIINLEVLVLPQPVSNFDVWICNDDFFTIGGDAYNETGDYSGVVLTNNDCDSIVNLELLVIECEIVGSTAEVPVICNGSETGILIFSVDQGEPPLTWTYTNVQDGSITGTGMTNLLVNNEIPGVPAGLYQIYIEDNFGNDVVVLQEVTEPTPMSVELMASDYAGYNVSCNMNAGEPGNDGTIFADPIGGVPPYEFLWSDGQTTQEAIGLTAGDYDVVVTDDVGCPFTIEYTLTAPPPLEADILFSDPTCEGFETGMIEVISMSGENPPYQYSIDSISFSGTDSFGSLLEGEYTIHVEDSLGCVSSFTQEIIAPDIPVVSFDSTLVVPLGDSVLAIPTLNNTTLTDILWELSSTQGMLNTTDDYLSCNDCLEPYNSSVNNSTYNLTVTSIDGCTASANLNVVVDKRRRVFVANIFSPDGDGINDRLIINAGPEVGSIQKFRIMDRWGNLLHDEANLRPNDPTGGWDGRLNGQLINPSVVVWVADVEFIDGVVMTLAGDVTVIR